MQCRKRETDSRPALGGIDGAWSLSSHFCLARARCAVRQALLRRDGKRAVGTANPAGLWDGDFGRNGVIEFLSARYFSETRAILVR